VSVRLVADVLDHVHGIPHGSKLVLICMADYANKEGICWPSFQSIADRADMSRRHAIRVVDDLCKSGYLSIAEQRPYKPTLYRLHIPTSDAHVTSDTDHTSDAHVTTIVTPMSLGSDAHVTSTSDIAMSPEPPIEPSKNHQGTLSKIAREKSTSFPDDFQPPYEWAAKELGMTVGVVDAEIPRMRDWALSKGERKKDWTAFARNWLRRKHDEQPRASQNGQHLTANEAKYQRNKAAYMAIANGEKA
jgi:hypothetical protein